MKTDTALRHRTRAVRELQDLHHSLRISHGDFDYYLERKAEIRKSIKHCPGWVRAYFSGQADLLFKQLYQNELEFCYLLEGDLYSVWKKSTHKTTDELYRAGRGHELALANEEQVPRAHYWRGTDIIFS